MREIQTSLYDSRGYSDENMLLNYRLIKPATLSKNLTYLYGKDSDMFPLLTMTEGQNAIKSIKPVELNDTQYTWNVIGRMKHTSRVVALATGGATPGINNTPFEVIMEDDWFIHMYTAYSPDGRSQVRIQSRPQKLDNKRYKYTFVLQGGNPTAFVDPTNFEAGKAWVMGAPTVAASKSDGNSSNSMAPGKMTNQFGFNRFTKNIAGNMAHKVVDLEFKLKDGGVTNLWMPFEMKLFELDRRFYLESDLWYSEYNRDEAGYIALRDEETKEPIPRGAGVKHTLRSFGNYDTYADLTLQKFDNTINAIFDNRVDDTPIEIILYTGRGGTRMFHKAVMADAVNNNYFVALGDKVISGGEYLSYGRYFNQYKTIDGKIITVKEVNLFNHGPIAEMQRANGDMIDGLPRESYTMVFLDHSKNNEGDRNIQLVCEKGREVVTGVYKGISDLPGAWGAYDGKLMSTTKDVASYEIMSSQGFAMLNGTTSFWLELER